MRRLGAILLSVALFTALEAEAQSTCSGYPALCQRPVSSIVEQADLDIAIDVVFVGDGFTNGASWQSVANSMIAQFRSAPSNVYGRVPNLFNFHVVDIISATTDVDDLDLTDTALGMRVSGAAIQVDQARAQLAALNAPDVDVVVAVANASSGRANASYNSQLASGGLVRIHAASGALTHEFGHALFRLADEYEEAAICTSPNESSLLLEANVTTDPTCHKFSGIAGASCVQGGKYCSSGVFRSSGTCLMRSNGSGLCPVCSREVEEVLRERRSARDWAPPWVIGLEPGTSGLSRGFVSLAGRSHDDWFRPTRLAFEVDGTFVGSADEWSQVEFDSRRFSEGTHQLQVFASDQAGFSARGRPLAFTIQNGGDTTPPSVQISNPADGSSLSGWVWVSVQASLDTRDLILLVDGVPVTASADSSGLTYFMDAGALAAGVHQLVARATDYGENVATSSPINFTSAPSGPPMASAPVITRPTDGTTVGPWFLLEWSSGGGGGVVNTRGSPVELVVDNVLVSPNPLAGRIQSAALDARAWSSGLHQLRVRSVIDGVAYESDPVVVARATQIAPEVYIRAPEAAGDALRGVVDVEVAASDDAPISGVSLLADGQLVGVIGAGVGAIAWATNTFTGCPVLMARAVSADGGIGYSAPASYCVDNFSPSVTISSPRPGEDVGTDALVVRARVEELGSSVARVVLRVDGQSVFETEESANPVGLVATLTPGPHSLLVEAWDRAGNVGRSASISVNAGACTVAGCDDGNACTSDRCGTTGTCLHVLVPGCCSSAADCDDGDACTADLCNANGCQHSKLAGCCNHDFDCNDGSNCTEDRCTGPGGTCVSQPAECCSTSADCVDGQGCTVDVCVGAPNGFCAHDWTPGCCSSNADCNDGRTCTTDTCTGGVCLNAPVSDCCETSADCADSDPCTSESCISGQCVVAPLQNCCEDDLDCPAANQCMIQTCDPQTRTCASTLVPNCCNFDFECADQDPCSVHACQGNVCVLTSATLGCEDAGVPDAEFDGGVDEDAGGDEPEAGPPDREDAASESDASIDVGADRGDLGPDLVLDAGPLSDAGSPDRPIPVMSVDGAASDAQFGDGSAPADLRGSCACGTVGGPRSLASNPPWLWYLALLFVLGERRARHRRGGRLASRGTAG